MQRQAWPRAIISGGQTGVDRGALDAAMALGLEQGGWCPLGRRAEDGIIPPCYSLRETRSRRYAERTRHNVLESAGTLVLCRGEPTGGTALTVRLARQLAKPCLVLDLDDLDPEPLRAWLAKHAIDILNVAGPRESECPGTQARAAFFLVRALHAQEPDDSRG